MEASSLRDLLLIVFLRGSVCIEKRRLLNMVGYQHDYPKAWKLVLDEWQEINPDRKILRGLEYGAFITILATDPEPVTKWAAE